MAVADPVPVHLHLVAPLSDDELEPIGLELDPRQFADDDDDTPAAQLPAARWRIDDVDQAQWAMSKYVEAHQQVAELERQRDEWRQRVDDWFDRASRSATDQLAFFESRLVEFQARRRRADEKRNKTLFLPSGEVRSRGTARKVDVLDVERVVPWCDASLPDDVAAQVVRREPKLLVSELRKHVQIVDQRVAVDFTMALSCDHEARERRQTPAELDAPDPQKGDDVLCADCDAVRTVVSVERRDVTMPVVLGPGGDKVPGVMIVPESVDYAVVPK